MGIEPRSTECQMGVLASRPPRHEDGNPEKQKIFKNDPLTNARDKFCDWVFKQHCSHKKDQPLIFVAHYLKGYDGYFVLEYLYLSKIFPKAILTGNKVMTLIIPQINLKFIDSFNFLSMSLSKFPTTFGLTELRKGYFPHHFNTEANQNYQGCIPDLIHYRPDSLPIKARMDLRKWHAEQVHANYVFDMPSELQDYCISDVNILREGCENFHRMCRKLFGLDPLIECITLASYCQLVYRARTMPVDSIAIIPAGGHGGRAKQSAKALRWIEWV